MKNNMIKVAIIPAYNEEKSIASVILRTRPHVDGVIVCDDGSADLTFAIANALGAKVVRHGEKRGKGEALRTLYKEAMALSPDILVTIDGDGQHDPDEIDMIVKPIETGASDLVVGSRYIEGSRMDAPFYRRFGLRVINFLYNKTTGVRVKDTQSGFRAYSRKALEFVLQGDANGYGIEGEQLVIAAKNGLRVMEVPISVKYNGLHKSSKKSPLLHGADLIFTLLRLIVEERPLMYLGIPGIALTVTGIISALYSLWMFNITQYFSIPLALVTIGTSILGSLLIISSITLHGLSRIHDKLKRSNE